MSDVSGEGPASPAAAAPDTTPRPVPAAAPDPAPGPAAAVPAGPETPRRRRRRRRAAAADAAAGQAKSRSKLPTVAATTAVTALITTVIGGVLSQDRIDSLFGDDDPTESADSSSAAAMVEVEVDYKHVSESGKAIAVDVPETWGAVDAVFGGIGGVTSPGRGLRSGPDPMAVVFASDETVWVGASTQTFDDLGVDALDDAAVVDLFEGRLEGSVYLPAHGCAPSVSHAPRLGEGWVGAVKAWQDCSAIDGWRAIEVEMISSDRDVYVYVQIGLAPTTPDEVGQRILDSLSVLPAKLPTE